jgi:hypothetical protein
MTYYAEAFSIRPGQCFRFIQAGTGHAQDCPAEVAVRGRFRDRAGKWHTVESCIWHAEPLDEPWERLRVTRPLRGGRSA